MIFLRKKYWEIELKVQIKLQFLKKISDIITKNISSKHMTKRQLNIAKLTLTAGLSANINLDKFSFDDSMQDKIVSSKIYKSSTVEDSSHNIIGSSDTYNILNSSDSKEKSEAYSHNAYDIEILVKDFNNMSHRLKILKREKKSIKLKLKKLCKKLLHDLDAMYESGLNIQTIIQQFWEIKIKVSPEMFADYFDEDCCNYFLKSSALEAQAKLTTNDDFFFQHFVAGNVKELANKLDSLIDFSADIEYQS